MTGCAETFQEGSR